ncbi:biopolymer transporter ExbD [Poseidonocella sp. HB161398]|uniref:ExbD/TolR family protein n=1 Tax=Poseidonocella sp. HB161398 TaxID=2320855 RepID=UPI0011082137|nr:biopolymer transporter ExbD [Poseidonocella sp. HB161398]
MSLSLATRRRSRRPSLTPMIDVVFLLLVFFMLASRFGMDMQIPLGLGGSGGAERWSGPPRLVQIEPDSLALNGVAMAAPELVAALSGLTETPADPVVLRAGEEADVQRLVEVMETLGAAGFSNLVLVE